MTVVARVHGRVATHRKQQSQDFTIPTVLPGSPATHLGVSPIRRMFWPMTMIAHPPRESGYGRRVHHLARYMRPAGFRSSIADELNCYTGQASLCVGTVTVRALAA